MHVEVRQRQPGSFGPQHGEFGPGLAAVEVEGRWVLTSPVAASVGLEDGSSVTAVLRSPVSADSSPTLVTEEDLRAIALGVTAADAAAAGEVHVPSRWLDPSSSDFPLCEPRAPS